MAAAAVMEPTVVRDLPMPSAPKKNFAEIEDNDAETSCGQSSRWDLDANIANLRKLERTGIWDLGDD